MQKYLLFFLCGWLWSATCCVAQPTIQFSAPAYYPANHYVYDICQGDFNKDGHIDVALTQYFGGKINVYLGKGDGSFGDATEYTVGPRPTGIATADFNGDGKLDIIICDESEKKVSILFGNGDGTLSALVTYTVGLGAADLLLEDFNADGLLDVAVMNVQSKTISLLLGKSDGTFLAAVTTSTLTEPGMITAADFNGDNKMDIAVTSPNTHNFKLLLGNGNGSFTQGNTISSGFYTNCITSGDFNQDGKKDVAAIKRFPADLIIYLGDGTGSFLEKARYAFPGLVAPVNIVRGEFNGDNQTDLLLMSDAVDPAENSAVLCIGNGNGFFSESSGFKELASPTSAVGADVNEDGKDDIAFANYSYKNVAVFVNNSLYAENTVAAKYITFSNISAHSMQVNWTNGNGTRRIVVARAGSQVNQLPADGHAYSAKDAFGLGTDLGGGNFVVYDGTGNTVNLTGLQANTIYHLTVFEYTGSGAYANYLTSTYPENSQKTPLIAPIPATDLSGIALSFEQIELKWIDQADNEEKFEIFRSASLNGTYVKVGEVGENITTFKEATLATFTTYFYKIQAVNAAGASVFSNTVQVTTLDQAPVAPENLSAKTISSSRIDLQWSDKAVNETGFIIERTISSNTTFVPIDTLQANMTVYADSNLMANTKYTYRIKAINTIGNSAYSNESNATTLEILPATPENLLAKAISTSLIDLSWLDKSTNETHFELERSENDTIHFINIAKLETNTAAYSDSSLKSNTSYFYRIRTANAAGESGYSPIATAATLPDTAHAPKNLTAVAISSSQINISWQDESTNENEFILERSTGNNTSFLVIAQLQADSTVYIDKNLLPNTTYYYRISARNKDGHSGYAAEVSATTQEVAVIPKEEDPTLRGINIGPNPSTGIVNIYMETPAIGNATITITSVNGKQINKLSFEKDIPNFKKVLDVSNLPAGLYLLLIETPDQRILKNLMIH